MTLLFLFCLLCTDITKPNDIPILSADRIEVNHFWTSREKDIGNITIEEGHCVLDQLIIWKYNEDHDRFDVVHWEMLKDHRLKDRLEGDEKEAHIKAIDKRRTEIQKAEAKKRKVSFDDIVTYIDSDWVGFRVEQNRPRYNFSSEKHEVLVLVREKPYKFVAKTYIETNTLYDPEATVRSENRIAFGRTKFDGFKNWDNNPPPYIYMRDSR